MPSNPVPDISITYVNLNTRDLLRESLCSMYDQEWGVTLETIVVDNASKDGSVEMVREEFPQVKLIANEEYRGFGAGNNQAFDAAKGRHLLMLNTDTVVLPGALDAMVEFLDNHPEAGAMGCKLLNSDGSLQRSCWRGFPSLKFALVDAFYLWRIAPWFPWVQETEVSADELQHTTEVDHLLGACMLIPRRVLEEVGNLNEEYVVFLEETDLCYRIKQAGFRIYFDPKGKVIHYGQQTGRQVPVWSLVQNYRNYYKFCKINNLCSRLELFGLKITIMIASLIRIALWLARLLKRNRDLCMGMIKGYWTVFRSAPSFN